MTAKHQDPEYRANARIVRQQAASRRKRGGAVVCWRCGREIDEEQRWDVGHLDADGGHGLDNLAPEHRYKTASCIGNRAAGGHLGQARRAQPKTRAVSTKSTGSFNW